MTCALHHRQPSPRPLRPRTSNLTVSARRAREDCPPLQGSCPNTSPTATPPSQASGACMQGLHRLLQRSLQPGVAGKALAAAQAAAGGEVAACRRLARATAPVAQAFAARGFAATAHQAWRASAARPAAASFAAAHVSGQTRKEAAGGAHGGREVSNGRTEPPNVCLTKSFSPLLPCCMQCSCRMAACGSLALRHRQPCARAAQPAGAARRR